MNKKYIYITTIYLFATILCNLMANESSINKLNLNEKQTLQFINNTRDYIAAQRTCFNIATQLYWGNGRSLYSDLTKRSAALYNEFEAETKKLDKFILNISKISYLQTIKNSLVNSYDEGIKIADEHTANLLQKNNEKLSVESEKLLDKSKETLINFKKDYDPVIDQFQN